MTMLEQLAAALPVEEGVCLTWRSVAGFVAGLTVGLALYFAWLELRARGVGTRPAERFAARLL